MKINYKSPQTRLAILENLSAKYSSDFLKDYYLIGCQHLLPSTHLMLRSCFDMGLQPEKTALIGKCYSTSFLTEALMKEEGIYICPSSTRFDSHQSYDDQFQRNILVFLKDAVKRLKIPPNAKLIVLDDGGELIAHLNNSKLHFERIIGIEQTSSGYHKLANTHLKFPVINVARCSTKLMIESPMIIEAQNLAITNAINNLNLSPKSILIVGNGALGKYLKQAFRSRYDVTCYDKIPYLSEVNKEDLDIATFDLIIGATGSSILPSFYNSTLKKGVILASASSSDREFSASLLRRRVRKVDNCHTNLYINGAHLLNCGFPINFQGKNEDTVPLEKIQLTVALLFAAICQGICAKDLKNGLINLNRTSQKIVLDRFYSLNQSHLIYQPRNDRNMKHVI